MKKVIITVIIILIVGILAVAFYFFGFKTGENLGDALSKKDPLTGKSAITLISELDDEGLERAGVSNKESELIIDFMIEGIGLYDFEKIKEVWQELQDAGVTEEEYYLFVGKITELAMANDFDGLSEIGVTEEKIQLYEDNWDQEKAEAFVNQIVQDTMDAGRAEIELISACIGVCPSGKRYIGEKDSDKYFECSCRYALESEDLVCFKDDDEALLAGRVKGEC